MNRNKLIALIRYDGDTVKSLALKLGVSFERLSAKINEKRGASFSREEMVSLMRLYKLSREQLVDVFFEDTCVNV